MFDENKIRQAVNDAIQSVQEAENEAVLIEVSQKLDLVTRLIDVEERLTAISKIVDVRVREQITSQTLIDDDKVKSILSERTCNALKSNNCYSIGDVSDHSLDEIARFRNLGRKGCEEVVTFLRDYGFHIKGDEGN